MNDDQRIRVLVLSRSYPSDVLSTLGLWVEQPTILLGNRFDVRVVSPVPYFPPLPAIGPLRQYARFRGIPRFETRSHIDIWRPRFVAGPGRSLYAYEAGLQAFGARRTVDCLWAEFPFDLIHAHMIYPEGAFAHRLSERYQVPFVVSEHAPWTEEWFSKPRIRREAFAAARAAAALLPVSSSVRTTMSSFGVDGDRIHVVPVGVDGELFRLARPTDRRADQILFVGWINYMKGVDVLLRATDLLRHTRSRLRLVLAGGALYRNTRLQEERLRRLADSLDLDGTVTFVGRKQPDEIARLMRESGVVVLPSRAESFGAVLVEALACGTPVVATRCGGPEDIVTDEVGILVPPEDPEALAVALESVLDHPERYEREVLRAHALARFGAPSVASRIGDVYARVLSGAR